MHGSVHKTCIAFKTSIFIAYSRNISRTGSGGKFLKRYGAIAGGDVCFLPRDRKYRSALGSFVEFTIRRRVGLKKLFESAGAACEFIIYPESRAAHAAACGRYSWRNS